MADPNYSKLTSMHFHGWKRGLKTDMHYLCNKAAADAIKLTVDQNAISDSMEHQAKLLSDENSPTDESNNGTASKPSLKVPR